MYKKTLAAVSKDNLATQVVKRAQSCADKLKATLELKSVVEVVSLAQIDPQYSVYSAGPFEEERKNYTESYLEDLVGSVEGKDIHCSVEIGNVKQTIARYVENNNIDLTFVGGRNLHGIEKLLGSTAHSILSAVSSDVYLVSPPSQEDEQKTEIKNILVGLDLSTGDDKTLEKAKYLAKLFNAKLTLAYVVKRSPHSDMYLDSLKSDMDKMVGLELQNRIQTWDIEGASTAILYGSIAKSLCHYAKENHIDLMMLGYNSHPIKHFVLGSTASSALNRSACDVLVVKN